MATAVQSNEQWQGIEKGGGDKPVSFFFRSLNHFEPMSKEFLTSLVDQQLVSATGWSHQIINRTNNAIKKHP